MEIKSAPVVTVKGKVKNEITKSLQSIECKIQNLRDIKICIVTN